MANPTQSMSRITPVAPTEARRTFPSKIRALPIKKKKTRIQATRSRRPRELVRKVFKIFFYSCGSG
jgi:hypothetical protein